MCRARDTAGQTVPLSDATSRMRTTAPRVSLPYSNGSYHMTARGPPGLHLSAVRPSCLVEKPTCPAHSRQSASRPVCSEAAARAQRSIGQPSAQTCRSSKSLTRLAQPARSCGTDIRRCRDGSAAYGQSDRFRRATMVGMEARCAEMAAATSDWRESWPSRCMWRSNTPFREVAMA